MKNEDTRQEEMQTFTCTMYLDRKFYEQLNSQGKEFYQYHKDGYYAQFPAVLEEGVTLGNCVMSFCEVAYLGFNDKYRTLEAKELKCELYKPGQEDQVFNVLVSITYPGDKQVYHELLIFTQMELTESSYSYKLIGDQTMFAIS